MKGDFLPGTVVKVGVWALCQFCESPGMTSEHQEACGGGGPPWDHEHPWGRHMTAQCSKHWLASEDISSCSGLHDVLLLPQKSQLHALTHFHTFENTFFEWVFGKKMQLHLSFLPVNCWLVMAGLEENFFFSFWASTFSDGCFVAHCAAGLPGWSDTAAWCVNLLVPF